MKPAIELPIPEKPDWEERYARWFLKPKMGEAQFERWFGARWHWWLSVVMGLVSAIALFGLGLRIHSSYRMIEYEITESLSEIVDLDTLTETQQTQIMFLQFKYETLSALSNMYSKILALGIQVSGIVGFFMITTAALTQSERRGARLIIARLEKQLAEAQAKAPE